MLILGSLCRCNKHRPKMQVDNRNVEILQQEQKQLGDQQTEIANLENEVATASPTEKPDLISQIQRYSQMYQRNLQIFNNQLEQFDSLIEQSRNYSFY